MRLDETHCVRFNNKIIIMKTSSQFSFKHIETGVFVITQSQGEFYALQRNEEYSQSYSMLGKQTMKWKEEYRTTAMDKINAFWKGAE